MTDSEVSVTDTARLSPHGEALYEAGRAMLVGSADVGRELCKTMLTVSSGAVPVHVALIGLAAGKDFDFSPLTGALALLAPTLYLAAVCAFAYGYFPIKIKAMSLEDPASIEAARVATMTRRYTWARNGFALFGAGVIATLGSAAYFFTA